MAGKSMTNFANVLLVLLLTCLCWAAEDKQDYVDIEAFIEDYYLNPMPDMAPAALKHFLESGLSSADESRQQRGLYSSAYAFARIGQLEPNILPEYHELFKQTAHEQRLFLLYVLQLCGNDDTKTFLAACVKSDEFINEKTQIEEVLAEGIPVDFNPIDNVIESIVDIDLLWTEFTIIGNEQSVRKIISVLGWLYDGNDSQAIIAGETKWSLNSHCREHPKVAKVCREQLARATGPTQKVLEEIIDGLEISEILKELQNRPDLNEPRDANFQTETPKQSAITGPKAWALGCSAILTERNHHRHDLLAEGEVNWKNIPRTRSLIDEWWGIKTRADLLGDLTWLNEGGHRKSFELAGIYAVGLSEDQYQKLLEQLKDKEQTCHKYRIAREHYAQLRAKSIAAWDYARFINLCRWGVMAGYISEQEAWQLIMPTARTIQKSFNSWEDMGQNYLIGRKFWAYGQNKGQEYLNYDAFQRLLDMRSSPWNSYDWNMDLTVPDDDVRNPAQQKIIDQKRLGESVAEDK